MTLKLYSQPGSHPCATVEAALALKAIDYDRVDLLPLSQVLIGRLSYGGTTVPGMRLDGERIVGSRPIIRRLDALVAKPALLPPAGDPSYEAVIEAERWGDEVFQGVPRRIIDVAFLRRPAAMESYAGDAKLPLPRALLRPGMGLTARMMASRNKASDDSARADLTRFRDSSTASMPGSPTACSAATAQCRRPADRQHRAPAHEHRRRACADRGPSGRPAQRYFPPMVGEIESGVLPAEWLSSAAGA